jgi:hypothetical protein
MSLTSWSRRLRAIEARPSAQKPLRITGGLPSGSEMLRAMSAATRQCEPLAPALADELGAAPKPAPKESTTTGEPT